MAGVVIGRLIGLIIFLLIVAALTILFSASTGVAGGVVNFLSAHIWIVVIFTFLFLFGEIFSVQPFPLDLPAPPFNAFGSIFLVSFIFQFLLALDRILGVSNFGFLRPWVFPLYVVVFFLVLILGYVEIFSRALQRRGSSGGPYPSGEEKTEQKPGEAIRWRDVGEEFRTLVYEVLHRLRESIGRGPD